MSDVLRNEVSIELAGETRTMRASFAAIRAIEAALGKSMMAVINQVADSDLSVTAATTIIYHGLLGFDDKRLSMDQVGEAVLAAGLTNVSLPIVNFVSRSLSGVEVGKPEGQTPQ